MVQSDDTAKETDPMLLDQKKSLRVRWNEFWGFVWNRKEGTVLGRNRVSWGKIGVFYVIFYTCLGCWFAGLLAIFMQTVDPNKPGYTLDSSIIGENPGMGFRPMPDYETTLIRFISGDQQSYQRYVEELSVFLDQYEKNTEDTCVDGKGCSFNINDFGEDFKQSPCNHKDSYGYRNGTPCVLLKLNKIFDWEPDVYTEPFNETVPSEGQGVKIEDSIGVSCNGVNPSDKINVGEISLYPEYGFKANFFPFSNQRGYRPPLVFIYFKSVTAGVLNMIRCKAWAKNIRNQKFHEKEGQAHFELLVD